MFIGTAELTSSGNISGQISTLGLYESFMLVPREKPGNDNGPDFTAFLTIGKGEVGFAKWSLTKPKTGQKGRQYISLTLSAPTIPHDFTVALMPQRGARVFDIAWSRRP